ncbi:hypothetical protein DPMN_036640 [Dreissena polymorpha]|uniref:Uncharacterized protein n=1 Tax=Dreissena polymorpha TaxID=45954 RepID=A0A9D4RP22_DREPO|nr:hypothetical protein DPMN_036640 [Dreissena polymorpha]
MVQRILSVDFMTLCSNPASFGRMLGIEPTPDFVGWQRGLCALNWTQILQELDDSNSVVKKFIKQVLLGKNDLAWRFIYPVGTNALHNF